MPYLLYNEQGSIQLVDSPYDYKQWGGFATPGYYIFEGIEVGKEYDQALTQRINYKTALGIEWVVLVRLFITFLLSEDGQYFMKKVVNWLYKLFLQQKVNRFVKQYRHHCVGLGFSSVDSLKRNLYNDALTLLSTQLTQDDKNALLLSFKGE